MVARLTAAQRRALGILASGPMLPGEFAAEMWPDSEGWGHSHKLGNNASGYGAMMPKVGGGYLGRLQAAGLVKGVFLDERWQYQITDAGRGALAER